MMLDVPQLIGLTAIAGAALLVMAIVLRKQPRRIWLFALAFLGVGLGYLSTTRAPTDLARILFGQPV